jgi:hypothetical protein
MDLPDFLKPNSRMAPPGTDPLAMPTRRSHGPNRLLLIGLIMLMLVFCGAGAWGLFSNAMGANAASTPTVEATPFDPGVVIEEHATPTPGPTSTLITGYGLLTQMAESPTPASSSTTNPCSTPEHFLTQLACNDLSMTATLAAAQPGQVINTSGVDPQVTTIYIYPTWPPTAWVITATQTFTPRVEIVEVTRIITATPGPTQTPWFFITQPPVVTVVVPQTVVFYYTQESTVQVTVEVPVTVVVTATPTETPTPSPTP